MRQPVDVIFRKMAQKEQVVPQSVERGASYHAVHDPVPPSTGSANDTLPSVVVDAEPPRRASHTGFALALLVALAIGGALMHLALR